MEEEEDLQDWKMHGLENDHPCDVVRHFPVLHFLPAPPPPPFLVVRHILVLQIPVTPIT